MRRVDHHRGFTLIELMVVISIIALISAIAMPVTASALKSAQRSHCQENLRQIGLAFAMYGADFDDRYPALSDQYWIDHADNWSPSGVEKVDLRPNLVPALAKYLGDSRVLLCPNDAVQEDRVIGETISTRYFRHFDYDGTSYSLLVPTFFGRSQTQYPAAHFILARDFVSIWHCEYADPQVSTPAYNFLFGDGHVKFDSLSFENLSMRAALEGR